MESQGITPAQLFYMTVSEIHQLTEQQIRDLTTEHFDVLKKEQIQSICYNGSIQVSQLRPSHICKMTGYQIQKISDYLTREQITGISAKQICDWYNKYIYMNDKFIAELTSQQVSCLKMNCLTESQIQSINPDAIKGIIIEQLQDMYIFKFTPEQISMLTLDQVELLKPWQVNSMSSEQISALSLDHIRILSSEILRNLDEKLFKSLTPEQIAVLTPEQIISLNGSQIKALLIEQLKALTPLQLKFFTRCQLELFSEEQKKILNMDRLNINILNINDSKMQIQRDIDEINLMLIPLNTEDMLDESYDKIEKLLQKLQKQDVKTFITPSKRLIRFQICTESDMMKLLPSNVTIDQVRCEYYPILKFTESNDKLYSPQRNFLIKLRNLYAVEVIDPTLIECAKIFFK